MTQLLPSAHSKVGASSMYRWANCPGSIRECAKVPAKESSVYAADGTKAHELAAVLLRCEAGGNDGADVFEAQAYCANAPEDMVEAVGQYVSYVHALITPSDTMLIEQGFHLKDLHPDLYGTADAVVWKPYSRQLHVVDYKHGAGIAVEVKGNPQLRYYALGALLASGYDAREVTVTIVQPRCPHPDGPIRSETFDAFDLVEWSADLLAAVKRTEDPNAPLNPGDHCRFCNAAAVCPALHERATAMAQLQFVPVASEASVPVAYDPAKLKAALDFREPLKAWIKALDEFAYAEAMAGRLPAEVGYKLVEKRANRQWTNEQEFIDHMKKAGVDVAAVLYEPAPLRSPAQVEKILGKKQFKDIEAKFVVKKSSGYTLAPETDKRPAIRILDAAAEFANVPVVTEVTDE